MCDRFLFLLMVKLLLNIFWRCWKFRKFRLNWSGEPCQCIMCGCVFTFCISSAHGHYRGSWWAGGTATCWLTCLGWPSHLSEDTNCPGHHRLDLALWLLHHLASGPCKGQSSPPFYCPTQTCEHLPVTLREGSSLQIWRLKERGSATYRTVQFIHIDVWSCLIQGPHPLQTGGVPGWCNWMLHV